MRKYILLVLISLVGCYAPNQDLMDDVFSSESVSIPSVKEGEIKYPLNPIVVNSSSKLVCDSEHKLCQAFCMEISPANGCYNVRSRSACDPCEDKQDQLLEPYCDSEKEGCQYKSCESCDHVARVQDGISKFDQLCPAELDKFMAWKACWEKASMFTDEEDPSHICRTLASVVAIDSAIGHDSEIEGYIDQCGCGEESDNCSDSK